MTQYTVNFPRVPASYPPDQVASNYDPYLDGSYVTPSGDAVILYMIEPKLINFFLGSEVLSLTSSTTNSTIDGVIKRTSILTEVTEGNFSLSYKVTELAITFTRSSIAATDTAPDAPFLINTSEPALLRAVTVGGMTETVNFLSMGVSPTEEELSDTKTLSVIEASSTNLSMELTYQLLAIETLIALTD